MEIGAECFFCQQFTDQKCSECGLNYCQPEHLAIHRPQEHCLPFKIQSKPGVGRFMVATRDIQPLELILEDSPAVFGPNHDTEPICLECLVPVDGSFLCPICGLPLCGEKCFQAAKYHPAECGLLSNTPKGYRMKVDFSRVSQRPNAKVIAPEYCCITPLRLLALKKTDAELWSRVQMLMDHDEDRRKEEDYWNMFQINAVDFLRKICGFDYSEEEIFRATGIIRTNAFHVEHPYMKLHGTSGGAVFPTFSFLSHSCVANAKYSVSSDNRLSLRAQDQIPAGSEISIQYLSFMFGDLKRKSEIRDCWFFQCLCRRCLDPSECGSELSTLKCQQCLAGQVRTSDPRDLKAEWVCGTCSFKMPAKEVSSLCNAFDVRIRDIKSGDVPAYETILAEMDPFLDPCHYLVMTTKKYLTDFYGFAKGYKYEELPKEKMDMKIQYGFEFLHTLEKVDPGCPKWKGLLLFDLHKALMIRSNTEYNQGQISKEDFLKILGEVKSHLVESSKILNVEPEGTKEKFLAAQAHRALMNVKEILMFSQFI